MKIVLFANTEWYLYNFRRSLALALRAQGHEVLLLSPPGPYGEKLRQMGFDWTPAPMERRSLNPLVELRLVWWIRNYLKNSGADVVHGFTIKCAVYGCLAGRLARMKGRVSSVAGLGYVFISNSLRARLLRPVVRTLLRLALDGSNCRLILQNNDDLELFRKSGIVDPDHIRLIKGSGVNCDRFNPDFTRRASDPEEVRMVLPARLLWDKGVAEYVEAARRLKTQFPKARFYLAGAPDPGNPASVSDDDVQAWKNEGAVEVLGHVDDMVALFQRCDVVVLPSYREGLPKGLIEAAACECAMVSTDAPGCREVVADGVNGYLVKVQDVLTLTTALQRLLQDAELRRRMGRMARLSALEEFDERHVVRATIGVYQELLSPSTH